MVDGIECCPNCGCNLWQVVDRRAPWFGDGEIEERQCDHCRHRWEATIEPEPPADEGNASRYCVIFKRLRCPHCDSAKHHVYKSFAERGERYHRCDTCSRTFKSIER